MQPSVRLATEAYVLAHVGSGGGTAGVSSVNGRSGAVTLTKSDVNLDQVDNTSDVNKPVSTAVSAVLAQKANTSSLSTVATSGSYTDLLNKPTLFSGSYTDLTNKPVFATVATSGSYADLSNKPTIPAAQVNSDYNATSGVAQILNKPTLSTVATSGSYTDLSNKPTIPSQYTDAQASAAAPVQSVAGLTGAPTSAQVKTALAITESDVANLVTDLAAKAPLASPALTGTPTAPTATAGTSTTQLATTAFSAAAITAERSATRTLTSARINPRTGTLTAVSNVYTPSGDSQDLSKIVSPGAAYTIANPTGTPVDGNYLSIRIVTGSTSYAITWGTIYAASQGVALPTLLPISSTTNLQFKYDGTSLNKWILLGTDLPIVTYLPAQLRAIRTVSAATTATVTDGTINANTSSAGFTVTLPTPSTWAGQIITVKKITTDSNTLTVTTPSGVIEGGNASFATSGTTRPSYNYQSDGTNIWQV